MPRLLPSASFQQRLISLQYRNAFLTCHQNKKLKVDGTSEKQLVKELKVDSNRTLHVEGIIQFTVMAHSHGVI